MNLEDGGTAWGVVEGGTVIAAFIFKHEAQDYMEWLESKGRHGELAKLKALWERV